MVDYLDFLYSFLDDKCSLLRRWRIYSVLRLIIRVFSNCFLCLYFLLTRHNPFYSLDSNVIREKKYIVSLTTFPARIDKVWIVIESLLRQSFKPDMIILWLSSEQFPNIHHLPKRLLNMQKRGLVINIREGDLRSHKKYYYAFKEYSNNYIITVDDDVIYNSNLLLYLVQLNSLYPTTICCNCVSKIKIVDDKISPYVQWGDIKKQCIPSYGIMPIGVGGVLYPPNIFSSMVLSNDLFMNVCPFADDIWLNMVSHMEHIKVAKTNYNSKYLPVMHGNNVTLNSKNVSLGENDKQLIATRNYFISKYSIDPYRELFS